ncbi:hypothetical protein [Paraburkholderia lacunae]|uniref:Uncharacterized protein n=1 Tax=Paraburkholderia lacunae TaxID=2211104 RepID=A0A370NFT3_9BURK|nr:hypothetical protein [Paraburkholderia lacunae]RDK04476.1 hypothetical protein DLM46_00955 [Paraburkholderia lacunae]
MAPNNGYAPILNLLNQVRIAQDAGATIAALTMVYVGIDTMAWLALPVGQAQQGRSDFYRWVDTYLKADATQPYQYDGRDVYAARCAVLHQFSTIVELHRQKNPPKKFGYLDNGPHRTDGGDLVLISVAMLVRDYFHAATRFMTAVQDDAELKARLDSRMEELLNTTPIGGAQ